jgi:hypothetical protein
MMMKVGDDDDYLVMPFSDFNFQTSNLKKKYRSLGRPRFSPSLLPSLLPSS